MSAITDDIVAGDIPPAAGARSPEERHTITILRGFIKTCNRNGQHALADWLVQVVAVIEDGQVGE